VTVTATSGALGINGNPVTGTAQVEVYVPITEFTSLTYSKEPTLGQNVKISASFLPAEANQSATYSVVNGTGAATIDSSGNLQCTRIGTVTVNAISTEVTEAGTHLSKSLTVTIHPYVTSVLIQPSDASLADANGDIHVSQGQSFSLIGSTLPSGAVQSINGWRLIGGGFSMHIGSDFRFLDLTASTSITTPATSELTATASAPMSDGTYASKTVNVTIHAPVTGISIGSAGMRTA
jgi:hypothetical protein